MTEAPGNQRSTAPGGDDDMRGTYTKVLLTWVVVLLALFAFQEYFS